MTAGIHITDIESAINYWRDRSPSPDGISACPQVRALAEVYGLMVYFHELECDESSMPAKARDAWLGWYDTTVDAPCIAICSTFQGDASCKGCGRTFEEVQNWTAMTPAEKRSTWRRITNDSTAWRFNRYSERASSGMSGGPGASKRQQAAIRGMEHDGGDSGSGGISGSSSGSGGISGSSGSAGSSSGGSNSGTGTDSRAPVSGSSEPGTAFS